MRRGLPPLSPGEFNIPAVQMSQGLRNLDRDRHHIEFRIHMPGIRPLMARDCRLGHERVHDPPEMALPGVGGPAHERAARLFEQACALQRP